MQFKVNLIHNFVIVIWYGEEKEEDRPSWYVTEIPKPNTSNLNLSFMLSQAALSLCADEERRRRRTKGRLLQM